jgi:Reeler domain
LVYEYNFPKDELYLSKTNCSGQHTACEFLKHKRVKKYFTITSTMLILVLGLSSFESLIHSLAPPAGYTGASGSYCTSCHQGNTLNNAGGMVQVNGLPDNGYTAGTVYTFSITTTHSAADRKRWGFSIAARNSQNQDVGTFSTTNLNAGNNGAELSHDNAVTTGSQSSYTYDNLTWTSPANPGASDKNITFYYAANAANGTGSSSGDYIYSGTKIISIFMVYTFTGNGNWDEPANWSNNSVPPANITGNASIVIDPPAGGECVLNVEQHIASTVSFTIKEGKKLRILGGLIISK